MLQTISSLPTEDSNREQVTIQTQGYQPISSLTNHPSQEPSRSAQFGPIRIDLHHKGKFQEHIQMELEAVQRQREKQKPQWLKQYEEQHQPPK